jgi:hypothetical protein
MIVVCPNLDLPVLHLFQLANTSIDPQSFRGSCRAFAQFDEAESDEDLWHFRLPNGEFRPAPAICPPGEQPTYFVDGSEAKLVVSVRSEVVERRPGGRPVLRLVAVQAALLSICWWETFLKSEHENIEAWDAERKEFDRVYGDALAKSVSVLGPPRIGGRDDDEDGHRYSIWLGRTGLLILQQSCYDPQFGLDVNYWVQPWSGPDPQPRSPFIDWLTNIPNRPAGA